MNSATKKAKYKTPLPSPFRLSKLFGPGDEFYHKDVQRILDRWCGKGGGISPLDAVEVFRFVTIFSNFSREPKKLAADSAMEEHYAKIMHRLYFKFPALYVELAATIERLKWGEDGWKFGYLIIERAEREVPDEWRSNEEQFMVTLAAKATELAGKRISPERARNARDGAVKQRAKIHAKWAALIAASTQKI